MKISQSAIALLLIIGIAMQDVPAIAQGVAPLHGQVNQNTSGQRLSRPNTRIYSENTAQAQTVESEMPPTAPPAVRQPMAPIQGVVDSNAFSAFAETKMAAPAPQDRGRLQSGLQQLGNMLTGGTNVTTVELKSLDPYDIVVIIDKSGSMSAMDCPGGMSRWEWCQSQLLGASRSLKTVLDRPITLALFSDNYKIFPRSEYSALSTAFAANRPSGGTYLSKPLRAVFDDYFSRKASGGAAVRKLMIQIITDGEPSDREAVIASINQAAERVTRPDEIKISFLQIGGDFEGSRTIQEVDQAGSFRSNDFVVSRTFPQVIRLGLLRCLVDRALN
jgi:hypothetical protein